MQPVLAKIKFLISRIAEAWQLLRLTLFSALLAVLGGTFLVLVTRRLRGALPDNIYQVRLRIWLPRIYGALALFALAYGFWRVHVRSWTAAYVILTALSLLYMVKHRAWFGNFPGTLKTQVKSLPPITRKLIHGSLVLSFVLLGLFVDFRSNLHK